MTTDQIRRMIDNRRRIIAQWINEDRFDYVGAVLYFGVKDGAIRKDLTSLGIDKRIYSNNFDLDTEIAGLSARLAKGGEEDMVREGVWHKPLKRHRFDEAYVRSLDKANIHKELREKMEKENFSKVLENLEGYTKDKYTIGIPRMVEYHLAGVNITTILEKYQMAPAEKISSCRIQALLGYLTVGKDALFLQNRTEIKKFMSEHTHIPKFTMYKATGITGDPSQKKPKSEEELVQNVCRLYFEYKYTMQETADLLGKSRTTVSKIIHQRAQDKYAASPKRPRHIARLDLKTKSQK